MVTDKILALLSQPAATRRPAEHGDDPTFGNLLSELVANNATAANPPATARSSQIEPADAAERAQQQRTAQAAQAERQRMMDTEPQRDAPHLRMSETLRPEQAAPRSNDQTIRDNADSRSVHKHTLAKRTAAKRQATTAAPPDSRLESKSARRTADSKNTASDPQGLASNPLATINDLRLRDAGAKALPSSEQDLLVAAGQGQAGAASSTQTAALAALEAQLRSQSAAQAPSDPTAAQARDAAESTTLTEAQRAQTERTDTALRADPHLASWPMDATAAAAVVANTPASSGATSAATPAAASSGAALPATPGANSASVGASPLAGATPTAANASAADPAKQGSAGPAASARDAQGSTLAKFGRDTSRGAALGQWIDSIGSAVSQALGRAVDGTTTVRSGSSASATPTLPAPQASQGLTPISLNLAAGTAAAAQTMTATDSPLNNLMQAAGLQTAGLVSSPFQGQAGGLAGAMSAGSTSGFFAGSGATSASSADIGLRTSIDAPFGSDAFNLSTTRTLKLMADEGIQRAEIALNPLDLGPLEIRLDIQGQEATISFLADQAQTRESLEKALPQLRDMLSEQGLTLGETHVGQRQASDQGAGQQAANRSWPQGDRQAPGNGTQAQPATDTAPRRAGRGLLDLYA